MNKNEQAKWAGGELWFDRAPQAEETYKDVQRLGHVREYKILKEL